MTMSDIDGISKRSGTESEVKGRYSHLYLLLLLLLERVEWFSVIELVSELEIADKRM
jgi:hypothetical protein